MGLGVTYKTKLRRDMCGNVDKIGKGVLKGKKFCRIVGRFCNTSTSVPSVMEENKRDR